MSKVSKLLLLNEKRKAVQYKEKTLDEINVSLDIEEDNNSDDDVVEAYNENVSENQNVTENESDIHTHNDETPKNISLT